VLPIRLEEEIHIDKPVQEVFLAWTTANELASWFAPMAVATPDVVVDFREGGQYSIRMMLPGDQVFTTAGVYKEIVTDEKIAMTWRCDAFPDPATLVTVLFLPDETGTFVKVSHENFESGDTCANHKQGWMLCLEKLKESVESK
jgi:uncharacterized protein YndB with AHSA1/START domain